MIITIFNIINAKYSTDKYNYDAKNNDSVIFITIVLFYFIIHLL